jgi:hypothetical protein
LTLLACFVHNHIFAAAAAAEIVGNKQPRQRTTAAIDHTIHLAWQFEKLIYIIHSIFTRSAYGSQAQNQLLLHACNDAAWLLETASGISGIVSSAEPGSIACASAVCPNLISCSHRSKQ